MPTNDLTRQLADACRAAMDCTDGTELNMSNYDHDDVASLNRAMVESYQILEAALKAYDTGPTDPLDLDLDRLEALEAAATPGPWGFDDGDDSVNNEDGLIVALLYESVGADPQPAKDGNFIVALRNAAPALIAAARREDALRTELLRLRDVVCEQDAMSIDQVLGGTE